MVGLVTGAIRFILEFAVYGQPPPCGSDKVDMTPDIIRKVHYLHFGCILFVISALVTIVVSLLTKPIDPRKVILLFLNGIYTSFGHYYYRSTILPMVVLHSAIVAYVKGIGS